jgi:hypothetical protein
MDAMTSGLPDNEMKRTRHGENRALPPISVLDGPSERGR